jgi:glyoxylase-like metal-dependent hydrolase (beta-lactamase superfamily II)
LLIVSGAARNAKYCPALKRMNSIRAVSSRALHTLLLLACTAGISSVSAQQVAVGTYTSPVRTFSTASYWIAGSDGVVMIDTQFLPREGLEALAQAERDTGKRVTHAVVLHPNPDKFNGTEAFKKRGVDVLTAQAVADAIPAVHVIRTGWFAKEYAPDYPAAAAQPRVFGAQTTRLTLSGVPLTLHVLGPGCSAAHVVVQTDDAVFVGDLINPENHAWLELGMIDAWLQRLEEIRAMKPKRIFPGRGKPGGIELLDAQAAYLRFVQKTARDSQPSGSLGTLRKWSLQQTIETRYPNLGFPIFMRDGLAAVWQSEAAQLKR